MTTTEEPILSRLDRLDNIHLKTSEQSNGLLILSNGPFGIRLVLLLKQLEEIRGCSRSPRSSDASTLSSGTVTSDGHASSTDFSPKSLEKHCRPIVDVIVETGHKGTIIERLVLAEDRVLKLCLQLEEEIGAEKEREENASTDQRRGHKRGLKHLVKACVKGKNPKI